MGDFMEIGDTGLVADGSDTFYDKKADKKLTADEAFRKDEEVEKTEED